MHQLILGHLLLGAHCAGDNVDGVVSILCEARITKKIMEAPSVITLGSWLKYSNHSKARLDWEAKKKADKCFKNTIFVRFWELLTSKLIKC